MKRRDYVRAESDFRACVRHEPRKAEMLRLLGRSLISQGECRAGIEMLLKAAKLDPDAKDIYANIAQVGLDMVGSSTFPSKHLLLTFFCWRLPQR